MTSGTGVWIARIHDTENFLTLARQYPNGRLSTKTIIARIQMFIRSAKLQLVAAGHSIRGAASYCRTFDFAES